MPSMAANSCGSAEARWSGPGRVRSLVKCFSRMGAPRATAPSARPKAPAPTITTVGAAVGAIWPEFGASLKVLGDLFLRLLVRDAVGEPG